MADQNHDTEITLGVGKLLGLFFLLVLLCGVFFGFGYSLGRNSAHSDLAATETAPAGSVSAVEKPGASQGNTPAKTVDCPSGQNCDQQQNPQDLTFYKAVEQQDANAELTPSDKSPVQSDSKNAQVETDKQPEMKSAISTGVMVQVAAVSKKEDAEALQSALAKKQYPVFVTSLPGDKFFRVQIGPFAELKDAEAMKLRLAADGYNAIVKR